MSSARHVPLRQHHRRWALRQAPVPANRFAVVRTQLRHGIHADEAVSTPAPPNSAEFEDERTGTASCETLVEADWVNESASKRRTMGMTR